MLECSSCSEVERDSQKVSGAWVFKGSRVPVRALFKLEDGATDELLECFPGVTKEQIQGCSSVQRRSYLVSTACARILT